MDSGTVKPIRDMSRVELEALAKARGLPARTRLSKRELMETLERWRGPEQDALSELRRMHLPQLLRIAKDLGIVNKWRMRKEDLVHAIAARRPGFDAGPDTRPTQPVGARDGLGSL